MEIKQIHHPYNGNKVGIICHAFDCTILHVDKKTLFFAPDKREEAKEATAAILSRLSNENIDSWFEEIEKKRNKENEKTKIL
jgi:hypothetical protein